MATFPNKFKKACEGCGITVKPQEGYCTGSRGDWHTYCKQCVPVQKGQETNTGTRVLTADGQVITPYEADNLDLYRAMPGAKWDRNDKCWRVSLKPGDRARLLEIADRLKLDVAPELREIELSEAATNANCSGLYPFQINGVDWLAKGTHRLLGDEMGLGKTVQTLAALPSYGKGLAIVPASLKFNWEQECRKWRPDLTPVVLEGRNSFRFPAEGELVITNYDILPAWVEPKKDHPNAKAWEVNMNHIPSQTQEACKEITLIVDEAHKVKNYKTNRSKRINGLSRLCGRIWALTGTPLENRPLDLWGTLSSLEMSRPVFGTFPKFISNMNGYKGRWGGYEFGTPKPIVPELMRRVMLQRKRDEVLPDLPRKQYSTIEVELPNELRDYMDTLWEEWGELIEKERELPPFEEFSTIRQQLAASRIKHLEELVEDHEEAGVPLVVFSAHIDPVRHIGRREGWAFIDGSISASKRQQIVEQFQAGMLKGIALTIRAGGVGLTLTKAWKVIFCDLDWVPSQNQQAEDRVCRIGQTAGHCEIVRLVSNHVLDKHVLRLIAWKMGIIEAALEKEIKATEQTVEVEPEEHFNERMARAVASVEGREEPRDPTWPEVKPDGEIPF
jgi:SWI/SNF-related matrix-associated actin-dependent regulator 1 of chromatin subfamily A